MIISTFDRYILKEQLSTFIVSLLSIIVILLINFIIKNFDRFLGKGLEILIIIEFILLNMAWIIALAVPMAVLISTLMGFGKLSSENAISAFRSSGISYARMIFPSFILGLILCLLMILFNNILLPDMNHKARMLSTDISKKRPDLEFNIGYFTESLPEYGILINNRDLSITEPPFIYNEIKIFSKQGPSRTVIAKRGKVNPFEVNGGIIFHLEEGTIQELSKTDSKNYRIIEFEEYDIFIPINNYDFSRRTAASRGDREMDYFMMNKKIEKYKDKIKIINKKKAKRIDNAYKILDENNILINKSDGNDKNVVDEINYITNNNIVDKKIKRKLINLINGLKSDENLIKSYNKTINKYLVELHKKFSIPFACIVFIILGAPLGIIVRNKGLTISFTMSLGFFIIYWSFLIAGEELADRAIISPLIAMWSPNFLFLSIGILMILSISYSSKYILKLLNGILLINE